MDKFCVMDELVSGKLELLVTSKLRAGVSESMFRIYNCIVLEG